MRKGFTLVETLISIGIFMVVVTIAVSAFVSALHTQKEVGTLISTQSNVSLGIEQMAREIRTGYLFCHEVENNTPTSTCGCVINADSSWTCSALDYYNSNAEHVDYSSVDGALTRSDDSANSGNALPLTSSNVTVKYLSFRLFGNKEGDGWTPRVTIQLGISPSTTDPAISNTVLNFETTVSARQIDCNPSTGSC
jgi:type II secretory pathway pseudopilin PulG